MEFSFPFYLTAIIFLFSPGIILNKWLYKTNSLEMSMLLCFAYSYALYALLFSFSNYFDINSVSFNNTFFILCLISIFLASTKLISKKGRTSLIEGASSQATTLIDFVIIVITLSIYHIIVGPYDQLPSDVYTHLTRYQLALQQQSTGTLGPAKSLVELFTQKANVWYHFIASLAYFKTIPTTAVLFNITLLSKTIFVIATYCFGKVLFQNHAKTRLLSLTAALLVGLHFGVNVFSYLRYYSFAPTMLAFIIYLAGLAIIANRLEQNRISLSSKEWLTIGVLIMALLSIHIQEATFLILYIFLIAVINICTNIKNKNRFGKQDKIIFAIGLISFFSLYFYAKYNLERQPNVGLRLWEFGKTSTEGDRQFSILNPQYQFMQVITLWGLMVFTTSVLFYKQIYKHPLLLAGTLIPIATVFNPFFVDIFLRLHTSTTLYRILYAIPLHFIAAICVVNLSLIVVGRSTQFQKLLYIPLLIALVTLPLLTFNKPNIFNSSRLWSLRTVSNEQGINRFSEILPFLTTIEKTQVITDPILGYYIGALSKHRYFRKNLYINHQPFTFTHYHSNSLSHYKGKLLIINKKAPSESDIGRISGHWHSNIMSPNKYYTTELMNHIYKYPKKFSLLWSSSSKDILIFKIN